MSSMKLKWSMWNTWDSQIRTLVPSSRCSWTTRGSLGAHGSPCISQRGSLQAMSHPTKLQPGFPKAFLAMVAIATGAQTTLFPTRCDFVGCFLQLGFNWDQTQGCQLSWGGVTCPQQDPIELWSNLGRSELGDLQDTDVHSGAMPVPHHKGKKSIAMSQNKDWQQGFLPPLKQVTFILFIVLFYWNALCFSVLVAAVLYKALWVKMDKWFGNLCFGGLFWRPLPSPRCCGFGSASSSEQGRVLVHPSGRDIYMGIDWAGWRAGRLLPDCFTVWLRRMSLKYIFFKKIPYPLCQCILKHR